MKTYQKQTDPMNQTYKSLPIIDIQPFINGSARRNVSDRVIEACKEIGFLIIKGHEIEEKVINDAFNASKSFFDLPQNIKNKWHPKEPSLQRGYHAFATRGLSYTLGEDTPPDLRETYFMGPVDDHSRHFQDVVSAQKAYAPNILPDDEIDLVFDESELLEINNLNNIPKTNDEVSNTEESNNEVSNTEELNN